MLGETDGRTWYRYIDLALALHTVQAVAIMHSTIYYPRESFREGLCNHRRWFVCLSVCLFVCYHDN